MKYKFLKKTTYFLFLITLIALYQNCGSYESINSTKSDPLSNINNSPSNENLNDNDVDTSLMSADPTPFFNFNGIPKVNFTTNKTAQIEWDLTDIGQGVIEYGETEKLGLKNTAEKRFKFAKHQQTIFNLKPNTKYYFQVKSVNKAGKEIVSDLLQFITLAEVETLEPTPPGSVVNGWNDKLPLGGRAIGVVTYGLTTGNAKLVSHKSSRRFLATRSGGVKSFAYLNRVLTSGDIERRAVVKRETEPVWYQMQKALGNDPKRGGYMLANSYSVGNGGLQEVTLQTDSGAPNHHPSGTVIATSERFIPFDLPIEQAVHIKFKQVGNIQAGQIYHLVFHNLTPPDVGLRNLTAEQAKNAPINKGAISLDGTAQGDVINHPADKQGPFMRDIPTTLIKESATSSWQRTKINAFFSVTYTDDVEVGEMYAHIHGQGAYQYFVDGNRRMRQQITWEHPNISVNRIVTRFGHTKTANRQPMSVTLKDQTMKTVATSSVPFDSILKTAAQSSRWATNNQTRHAVSQLSNTVTLAKGKTYYIEYSAPEGAGFIMSPALDPMLTRHGSKDSNMTANAFAQQSPDNGNTWKQLNAFPGGDLPMYLIPVGVPTQTPIPN